MKKQRKIGLACVLVGLVSLLAVAVSYPYYVVTLYEKITVTTGAAVALTTPPANCKEALILCETNDVRFRRDGTDPTSTNGILLEVGQNIILDSYTDIRRFKAIAVSDTGYLSVEYRVGF